MGRPRLQLAKTDHAARARRLSTLFARNDESPGSMFMSFGTFIPGAPNDYFSVKFVRRRKYCLEISKTRGRKACFHILYFLFSDRRVRVGK